MKLEPNKKMSRIFFDSGEHENPRGREGRCLFRRHNGKAKKGRGFLFCHCDRLCADALRDTNILYHFQVALGNSR